MLLGGPYWLDKVLSILGIFIMIFSTIYLNLKRKDGLVKNGPYGLVRNPQYFGAILFIINMTSRSYREVLGDVGWIGPSGTLLVWVGTLVAYILLAFVEEAYLSRMFGAEYLAYQNQIAFLIPFTNTGKRWLNVLLSMLIPAILLWGVVGLNRALYP
jgi:protein-S-isoprenylcysteine O-methyltransferase Ste14